jgi:polyhydroxybutyrate depolymerase
MTRPALVRACAPCAALLVGALACGGNESAAAPLEVVDGGAADAAAGSSGSLTDASIADSREGGGGGAGGGAAGAPADSGAAGSSAGAAGQGGTAAGGSAGAGGAAGSSAGAAGDAGFPGPTPKGCVNAPGPGDLQFDCDGLTYDVRVPPACVSSACGLVLDVHGATMSGVMEDHNTEMRALGTQHGFVVVQPNANPAPPLSSWNPGTDDDKVFAFLQLAMAVWHVDAKRVHMTGFSQGGMMTFRFICKHADVLASAAPAAGTGCSFGGGQMPSRELPILYMHGTKDVLVSYDGAGVPQKNAAVAAWAMAGPTTVQADAQHRWERYQNASGTVFELISHDYDTGNPVLGGHCYPGSKDLTGGAPGQLFGFACKPPCAFTWGQAAMQFFLAHPRP